MVGIVGFQFNCERKSPSEGLPVDWKVVNKDGFSIAFPRSFDETIVEGTDTRAYQFRNPEIIVTADYGIYAKPLEVLRNEPDFERRNVRISGRSAELIFYSSEEIPKKLFVVLSFADVDRSGNSLMISAEFDDENNRKLVLAILQSVKVR